MFSATLEFLQLFCLVFFSKKAFRLPVFCHQDVGQWDFSRINDPRDITSGSCVNESKTFGATFSLGNVAATQIVQLLIRCC